MMSAPMANFDITGAMAAGWRLFRDRTLYVYVGMLSWAQCSTGGSLQGDPKAFLDAARTSGADEVVAGVVTMMVAASLLMLLQAALFLGRCFVTPGWNRWLAKELAGEPAGLGVLLSGIDRVLQQALWRVIRWILVAGGTLAAGLPGVLAIVGVTAAGGPEALVAVLLAFVVVPATVVFTWLTARLVLGDALVALEGAGAVQAARRSWAMTADVEREAVAFVLAQALLGLIALVVGALTCCVGVFVTVPIWLAIFDAGKVRAVTTAFERPVIMVG